MNPGSVQNDDQSDLQSKIWSNNRNFISQNNQNDDQNDFVNESENFSEQRLDEKF